MSHFKLPCFYHPATVTLIDDDQIFLENLVGNLSDRNLYHLFDNAREALNFLQIKQKHAPNPQDYLKRSKDLSDNDNFLEKSIVNVNASDIHQIVYNKNRFQTNSVIVVDHDMPDVDGITFCKQFTDSSIKRIMLTGVADHKVAIKAFNEGIIHKFIMKDDPNVFDVLDNAIRESQNEYFSHLSELVIKNITSSTFSYLENPKFINFFSEIVYKYAIVEFYLIDPVGSFILLNENGEIIWLILKSSADFTNDYQIAVDQEAQTGILDMLKNKQKLLFLFSEGDYRKTVEQWPSHLYHATKMNEIEGCYYSLIQGELANKMTGIYRDKILPYSNYFN